MLNKTTETALMALLYLVLDGEDRPVSPRMIAERLAVSQTYLAKTFNSLRRAGILHAHRGAQGGVTLDRPAGQITLLEIVVACQELPMLDPHTPPDPMATRCNFHQAMTDLSRMMEGVLSGWTLADLAKDPCPAHRPADSEYCRTAAMCPKRKISASA